MFQLTTSSIKKLLLWINRSLAALTLEDLLLDGFSLFVVHLKKVLSLKNFLELWFQDLKDYRAIEHVWVVRASFYHANEI